VALPVCVLMLTGCGLKKFRSYEFNGPEARSWLRQNANPSALASNRFGSTSAALDFVEQLYEAGAEYVIIPHECIVPDDDDGPYADAMAVKLPKDPAKRKRVFELCAREIERQGFNPKDEAREEVIFLWWD
jgi:hypothetical protein